MSREDVRRAHPRSGLRLGAIHEIALETGAEIFLFDLSSALEVAYCNNKSAPSLHFFQGSILEIPLRKGLFDRIFCMGVLQHCLDPKEGFVSLVPFLRPGGETVIDVYEKWLFYSLSHAECHDPRRVRLEEKDSCDSWRRANVLRV